MMKMTVLSFFQAMKEENCSVRYCQEEGKLGLFYKDSVTPIMTAKKLMPIIRWFFKHMGEKDALSI